MTIVLNVLFPELSQWNDIKWCVKQRVYARRLYSLELELTRVPFSAKSANAMKKESKRNKWRKGCLVDQTAEEEWHLFYIYFFLSSIEWILFCFKLLSLIVWWSCRCLEHSPILSIGWQIVEFEQEIFRFSHTILFPSSSVFISLFIHCQ